MSFFVCVTISMDQDSVKFTAKDAAAAASTLVERNYHTYGRFANACRVRLRRFVQENPQQQFMLYKVPLVLMGGALHEPVAALNHIIHQLKRDGFDASSVGENLIFISWYHMADANSRFAVPDYVSTSVKPTATPPTVGALSVPTGPGRPQPPQSKYKYKNYINQQISDRQREYEEADVGSDTRALYTGAFSHQDAMKGLIGRRYE